MSVPEIALKAPVGLVRTAPAPAFDQRLAVSGFEEINRYLDPHLGCYVAKILPGQFYVTRQSEVIATVLGSCVAACVRDTGNGVGGMNHFMLPEPGPGDKGSWSRTAGRPARYGTDAMEQLINAILKAGGVRSRLEVKIFGGARVISDVGRRNVEFVRNYLETEGLELIAEDVGDVYPRHVQFFPDSGRARMRRLRSLHNTTILDRERGYLKQLAKDPIKGEVELF